MQDFPFTTSFWFDAEIELSPSLEMSRSVDVAIIGGGFAGLSAALHLKNSQPGLDIALVEAKHIGYGASGRNAGWVMSLPPLFWLLDSFDNPQRVDDVCWTSKICRDNITELGKLVDRESMNCDWTTSSHILVARNPLEVATLRWIAPRFQTIGLNCEFFEKKTLQQVVGYPATAAMAYEIVTIQPYRLAKGLRNYCIKQGVQIYEKTPISQIQSTKQGVRLITASGNSLVAQKVVLATNAYGNLIKTDVEVPAGSAYHTYMLATEPLDRIVLDQISNSRKPFGDAAISFYIGRIHENRFIFNGIDRKSHVTSDDDRHLPSFVKLYAEMIRRFPFLRAVSLAGAWGGAVQQTSTDAPIVRLSRNNPNVILNIGYGGGSGVGMALLSGRLVADLVVENAQDSESQRLRTLLENSRFPVLGSVQAAFGILKKMIFR
jgi:glycine/D-amino acid oxidase-like deaminating enzyme